MDKPTLDYYALHANEVAQRYEVAPSPLAHRFAESFSPCGRILDIGCGSGRDLAQLHKQGFQPYGVDGTEEFVQLAQMLHPELMGWLGIKPHKDYFSEERARLIARTY